MAKRKNILMVANNNLNKGGVQSVIMSIVRNLSRDYRFDIIVFGQTEAYYEKEFQNYGGQIYRCYKYEKSNRVLRRLDMYFREHRYYHFAKSIISKKNYQVIHCNNNYEAAPFLKAAKEYGISIRIVHTHVIMGKADILTSMLRKHYFKQILKYATNMIGCSEKACDSMFGKNVNSMVVHNAFDGNRFDVHSFEQKDFRAICILQIGNYSELKNQLFTINVVAEIKKEFPDVMCKLVGFDVDGYENILKDKIVEMGLQNNIRLLPSDSDTPFLLSEATALVQPSKTEAFGIVLIEAQAMGVLCYASTAVPNLINCGGVTFLSLNERPEIWAQKIIYDYRATKGKHFDFDVSQFSETIIMEKYREIYEGKNESWNHNISSSA